MNHTRTRIMSSRIFVRRSERNKQKHRYVSNRFANLLLDGGIFGTNKPVDVAIARGCVHYTTNTNYAADSHTFHSCYSFMLFHHRVVGLRKLSPNRNLLLYHEFKFIASISCKFAVYLPCFFFYLNWFFLHIITCPIARLLISC